MSTSKLNKTLDVHGLHLSEAINVIKKNIEIAYESGVSVLYVNHGFNQGSKIKTWCINNGNTIKNVIKVTSGMNEGITNFYIKTKIF